ncbi:hypothetical protein Leryth_023940, partial [Lithospermum erythrorhizon]
RNMIHEGRHSVGMLASQFFPEHAFLQTKVMEINLVTFSNVADAILANGMFSHYDRLALLNFVRKLVSLSEPFSTIQNYQTLSESLLILMQLSPRLVY